MAGLTPLLGSNRGSALQDCQSRLLQQIFPISAAVELPGGVANNPLHFAELLFGDVSAIDGCGLTQGVLLFPHNHPRQLHRQCFHPMAIFEPLRILRTAEEPHFHEHGRHSVVAVPQDGEL